MFWFLFLGICFSLVSMTSLLSHMYSHKCGHCQLCFYLFNKYLFRVHYVSGTVLGTGDIAMNKPIISALLELIQQWREINTHIST